MISRTRITLAVLFAACAMSPACDSVPLLAPSGSTITLTSAATALPLNGTAEIIAQVIEPAGTPPHRGTLITFTTTLGAVQPFEAETDANGRVIVRFSAGTSSGTATITAFSGGSSVGANGAIKIAVGTAAVGRVSVNANPASVPAVGGSTTITASVFDINGNALSLALVTFSTTAGSLSASTVVTDANGAASTILTTSQQATVTASVGAQAPATPPPASGGGGGTTTPPASSGQASGTVIVTVSAAPTLVITAPTTPIFAGLPATFIFTTTAPAGGGVVRNITVNWGDGRTQDLGAITGAVPVTHAYQSAGTFVITATLTDSLGNVVPVSTTVVVNARPQPAVTLTTTTPNPTAGTDVTFTVTVAPATGTNTVIDDVTIDYGDGERRSLGPITGTTTLHHVYQKSDTYTVTLRATDSNGGVGTAVTTVFVTAQPPLGVTITASAANPGSNPVIENLTATVTGLGNDVVTLYQWNFGDGTPLTPTTTNQTSHAYARGVTVTVTVTVTTASGRQTSGTLTITPQ
jgi:adhesin/invasin